MGHRNAIATRAWTPPAALATPSSGSARLAGKDLQPEAKVIDLPDAAPYWCLCW